MEIPRGKKIKNVNGPLPPEHDFFEENNESRIWKFYNFFIK